MRTTVLVGMILAAGALPAHPWSCYHGNPQHTGLSPFQVGDSLGLAWRYQVGAEISGSPVVLENGDVIFGARDTHLYCLHADSTLSWRTSLGAYGTSIYFSTPAVDDSGYIYMTTNRKLLKLDAGGNILWAWPSHNSLSISHSPVIGLDGKVYFACYSDSLYALNPDSTMAWARDLGNSVNSTPAVGADGRIYVATTRGTNGWKLWAFNPDGSSPWSYDLAGDADFSSPAIGPDSIVYVGANRYLYAIGPGGTLRWRDSLSARIQSCPAIASESTLYVVAGARLYCVDADSGVRWRKSIGGSNYCAPAIDADGRIYVGSADNTNSMFYVIGPDSSVLWSYPADDDFWSSPAIGPNNRVYVGGMDGYLYAFEGPGAGVSHEPTTSSNAGPIRLWPNPTRGALHLVGRPAAVRVFDAAGRMQRTRHTPDGISLAGLTAGVYVVELTGDGTRTLERVILR